MFFAFKYNILNVNIETVYFIAVLLFHHWMSVLDCILNNSTSCRNLILSKEWNKKYFSDLLKIAMNTAFTEFFFI